MKFRNQTGLTVVLSAAMVFPGCGGSGTPGPDSAKPEANLMIDDFTAKGKPPLDCSPFGDEKAEKQLDYYCVHFINADARLAARDGADHGLSVLYSLPRHPEGGTNWLSIRREDGRILDLAGYKGVRLRFRIKKAADAVLRVTLADVSVPGDAGRKNRDELWWCDHHGVLQAPLGEWQTVECPFSQFRWADVGRPAGDHKLTLSQITAYELTFVSEAGTQPAGEVEFGAFDAYK